LRRQSAQAKQASDTGSPLLMMLLTMMMMKIAAIE